MSTERVLFIGTPSVTLAYVPTYHAYQDYLVLRIQVYTHNHSMHIRTISLSPTQDSEGRAEVSGYRLRV